MKFNTLSTLFVSSLIILASVFTSCSESCDAPNHDETSEISETSQAIAIHNASSERANEFRKSLVHQFQITENTDSNFIKLVALDSRYKEWKKTMVKLPGTECNHAPGEEHHHDHEAEALLEGLSEAELITLQEAISSSLDEIIADFDKLVSESK